MRVEGKGLYRCLVGQATGLRLVASTSQAELIAALAVTRAITEYFVLMTAQCTVQHVQLLLLAFILYYELVDGQGRNRTVCEWS